MNDKRTKYNQGNPIIASIVYDAIKPSDNNKERLEIYQVIKNYVLTREEPKFNTVLGDTLWTAIRFYINSNVIKTPIL